MNPGIDALLQRTNELVQERADLAARIRTIDTDMATLKRAAEILSPGTVAPISSKTTRTHDGAYKELTQAMLEVLREATTPITAAEVGTMALVRIGHDANSIPRSTLTSKATTALNRYALRGTVQRILEVDCPIRWCVAR